MPDTHADVSVVIPTFDRPDYLNEALHSVVRQSLPPREIIVVDNGTDAAMAKVTARYADRVRYLRQPPLGVQVARNAGIEAATGQWIALLDDDDLYRPDHLERCWAAMADGLADIVCADHVKFGSDGEDVQTQFAHAPLGFWDGIRADNDPAWSAIGRFPVARLLRFIPFYPSQIVMRRNVALAIGGFDPAVRGIVAEDVDFLVRLLSAGTLAIVWSPGVRYRVHATNDSRGWDAQAWGRWTIFNGLVAKPAQVDPAFLRAFEDARPALRSKAFDAAYGLGRTADVRDLAGALRASDWSAKRLVKLASTFRLRRHSPQASQQAVYSTNPEAAEQG